MLHFVFGKMQFCELHINEHNKAGGFIELERARVRWFLSIDFCDLPDKIKAAGQRTYRSLKVSGNELEFSNGFADLHTMSYEQILQGKGFSIKESQPAIELVAQLRGGALKASVDRHPLIKNP
jgi:UDP-N-acetyl-2-amino-2-deoxyglucuronate dehydrogenase